MIGSLQPLVALLQPVAQSSEVTLTSLSR